MSKGNGGGQSRRREPRRYVDEPANLSLGGEDFACRIVDITSQGAGLYIDSMPANAPGECVLSTERFGTIHCNIKYMAITRIGLQFILSDQARDKLNQMLGDVDLH